MNHPLRISLAANLVLLAAAVFFAAQAAHRSPATAPSTEAPGMPESAPSPPPVGAGEKFQWRQLEAADYPTYIANLRGVHCPERTVRSIVAADVADLFARKRFQTRGGRKEERWSGRAETNLVNRLLGTGPAPVASAAPNATAPAGNAAPSNPKARIPVILRTEALAALPLSDDQRSEIAGLTGQFIQEIGGLNQDPSDPAYAVRWREAQTKADAMIIATIGRRGLVDLDQFAPPVDDDGE